MNVRFYADGNSFLAENKDRMLEQEAVFQLLCFNVLQNRETPLSSQCFFGSVEEAGRPILLFGRAGSMPLTLNRLQETGLSEASEVLVLALQERGFHPEQYIADGLLKDRFFEQWKAVFPSAERRCKLAADIMQMDVPADVPLAAGRCRQAEEADLPIVYRYISGFRADTGNDPNLSDEQIESYANRVRGGDLYLYETSDGHIVSQVYVGRRLIRGVCLTGVYTPPEERGKGYAAANVLLLSKKLLREGAPYVTLFVDKQNPISNHVYQKIGYRILRDSWQYEIS